MSLKDIIFRELVKVGHTTKPTELSHLELDQNFEQIIDYLNTIANQAVSGIEPYNPVTVYDPANNPIYVSYDGNIYLFIAGTPTSGATPSTEPLIWELSSMGALIHKQDTDTVLAKGTGLQVTAAELRAFLDNVASSYAGYISLTYAEYESKALAGELLPYTIYNINDIVAGNSLVLTKNTTGGAFSLNPTSYSNRSDSYVYEITDSNEDIDVTALTEFQALDGVNIFKVNSTGAVDPLRSFHVGDKRDRFAIKARAGTNLDIKVLGSADGAVIDGQFCATNNVAAGTYSLIGDNDDYIVCEVLRGIYGNPTMFGVKVIQMCKIA